MHNAHACRRLTLLMWLLEALLLLLLASHLRQVLALLLLLALLDKASAWVKTSPWTWT